MAAPQTKATTATGASRVKLPPLEPSKSGAPALPRVASALALRFQQICTAMIAEALAGEALVQFEYGTLVFLEIEPGIDQQRLSEALGIDPSHVSLVVERLHSMGLIERHVDESDRRARKLYLTPDGKRLWRRLRPKTSAANERVLTPLAPRERELFLDFLIRVIDGNRAYVRPGAGRRKRGSLQSVSSKT